MMKEKRVITIKEESFESKESVLSYIANELEFPDYFGMNYDALNDCMGDIETPTEIEIIFNGDAPEKEYIKTVGEIAENISKWNSSVSVRYCNGTSRTDSTSISTIYDIVAEILRSGIYERLKDYLDENCEMIYCKPWYNEDEFFVKGKDSVVQVLMQAQNHDSYERRFRVRLWCGLFLTTSDQRKDSISKQIPVIQIHEDISPPYHKVNMYLATNEKGNISSIHMIEEYRDSHFSECIKHKL